MKTVPPAQILVYGADRDPVSLLLEGISRYRDRHGLSWPVRAIRGVERWRIVSYADDHAGPTAIAGLLRTDSITAMRAELGLRSVTWLSTSTNCDDPEAYRVTVDDASVGTQAVDHLLAMGYPHLACWGAWNARPRIERFAAAERRCAKCGIVLHRLAIPPSSPSAREGEDQVMEDLAALPRPLGIIAHQDRDSVFLRSFCANHGLKVPTEIGIVGADDSPSCTAERPQLSSVRVPWRLLGEELAATWHHLTAGTEAPSHHRTLTAYGVAGRASTDLKRHGAGDAVARAFLDALKRRACGQVTIAGLARELGVSPATLHRRVVAAVGRSPQDLLHDARVERACALLRETDLGLAAIAKKCGYASPQRLHAAFTARFPVPPGAWRRG